jgi:putative hydrolase of the HAD superfamily
VSDAIAASGEIRGVVFDMDDTLYPEMQFVDGGLAAAAVAAAERFGVHGEPLLRAMRSALTHDLERYGRARNVFDEALAANCITPDPQTIAWLVSVYRTHEPDLTPYADVKPALEVLAPLVPLGLITDGPLEVQRRKFDSLALRGYFAHVVFTDEHGPDAGKPSPAGFRIVEELMGLPGHALAYVADNPAKDFVGARDLGWKTVRVRRAEGLHASVTPEPAFDSDAETDSLADVARLLGLGP